MTASTFKQVQAKGPRPRGCPRCGNPAKNSGLVHLRLASINQKTGKQKAITSRGISFCESCSVQVYSGLLSEFEEMGHKGES